MAATWDNLTNAELAAMPVDRLEGRMVLYAIIRQSHKDDAALDQALQRCVDVWTSQQGNRADVRQV